MPLGASLERPRRAKWIASGRRPAQEAHLSLRVADVGAAFLAFAKRFFDGTPPPEVESIRNSVGLHSKLYGTLPVHELGPRQVKALREQMITVGLVRKTINDRTHRVGGQIPNPGRRSPLPA